MPALGCLAPACAFHKRSAFSLSAVTTTSTVSNRHHRTRSMLLPASRPHVSLWRVRSTLLVTALSRTLLLLWLLYLPASLPLCLMLAAGLRRRCKAKRLLFCTRAAFAAPATEMEGMAFSLHFRRAALPFPPCPSAGGADGHAPERLLSNTPTRRSHLCVSSASAITPRLLWRGGRSLLAVLTGCGSHNALSSPFAPYRYLSFRQSSVADRRRSSPIDCLCSIFRGSRHQRASHTTLWSAVQQRIFSASLYLGGSFSLSPSWFCIRHLTTGHGSALLRGLRTGFSLRPAARSSACHAAPV